MTEKGFLTKATQGRIVELLTELLAKKEITGLKAKLIITAISLGLRLGDDVFAEKVGNEELRAKTRKVLEAIIVDGDVDVTLLIELVLELIELFKKDEA